MQYYVWITCKDGSEALERLPDGFCDNVQKARALKYYDDWENIGEVSLLKVQEAIYLPRESLPDISSLSLAAKQRLYDQLDEELFGGHA